MRSLATWLIVTGLALGLAARADEADPGGQFRPSVTAETLEQRIAEVQAAPDMQEDTRTVLLELYRKALDYLGEAENHATRATSFEVALYSAQAETQSVRDETAALQATDPEADLGVVRRATRGEIKERLEQVEADLAAAEARRADLAEQMAFLQDRAVSIGPRLDEARQRQEETAAALAAPAEQAQRVTQDQARRWVLETRYATLAAEITSLDLEERSRPVRLRLLEARRNREVARIQWTGSRRTVLASLVNERRQRDVEEVAAAAEAALRDTGDLDPLLDELAVANADLARDLTVLITGLDGLDGERAAVEKLVERVAADHRDAEAAVATGGEENDLGTLLLEFRERMPDVQTYGHRVRDHDQQVAAAGVRRLHHQAEARHIADVEPTLARFERRLADPSLPGLRARLDELLQQRRELLASALEAEGTHLQRLQALTAAEHELLAAVTEYNEFLIARLLWLRSAEPTHLADLADVPDEVRLLFSPATWSDPLRVLTSRRFHTLVAWLAVAAAAMLLWRSRALKEAIAATEPPMSRPDQDSIAFTWRALGLTLLLAAPLPLVPAALGWQLHLSAEGTDFTHAVGSTLVYVALYFYILIVLRMMCIRRGLAAAHFGWPKSAVEMLRSQLDRFTWLFVLSVLLTRLAVDVNPVQTGGILARLGFLVYAGVTAYLFLRVLHPRRGVLASWRPDHENTLLRHASLLLWWLLTAVPLALAVLALAGYVYSAGILQKLFQQTVWLGAGLVVVVAMASRSMLVTERRLAYEAAVEKRRAELAARKAEREMTEEEVDAGLHVEEPKVDLSALSDDSRELLKVSTVFAGLAGLSTLWSPVLPALGILNDITLWYRTLVVDGEVERIPVTLASLVLALIYGGATGVLARRLPGLVEITLLRTGVSSGGRYTATTLTRYTIIAVGVWLVLNTLGARWSQFQWLVAALGVGIGFGLQEIVANFISGLIMLFERPVRVGDVVTVGEISGVVTRIQIRATTILGWDHTELVVPNREFITGRLLNWTLSDRTIRVTLNVGIAYGSDVELALRLMREAAEEQERVLEDPAPVLTFEQFGDSALDISLRAHIAAIDYRLATVSGLHKAINRKFADAGIIIAFPQRHVHLQAHEPLPESVGVERQENPGEV